MPLLPCQKGMMIMPLSRELGHAAVPFFTEAELHPDAPVLCFNH